MVGHAMSQRRSTGMEGNKSWPVRWKSGHTCPALAACRLSTGDEIRIAPTPAKANTAFRANRFFVPQWYSPLNARQRKAVTRNKLAQYVSELHPYAVCKGRKPQ